MIKIIYSSISIQTGPSPSDFAEGNLKKESGNLIPDRNSECKRGTFPNIRLHSYLAPVPLDDPPGDCKPDPRPGVFFLGVEPLEDLEYGLSIGRINPDPVVLD